MEMIENTDIEAELYEICLNDRKNSIELHELSENLFNSNELKSITEYFKKHGIRDISRHSNQMITELTELSESENGKKIIDFFQKVADSMEDIGLLTHNYSFPILKKKLESESIIWWLEIMFETSYFSDRPFINILMKRISDFLKESSKDLLDKVCKKIINEGKWK